MKNNGGILLRQMGQAAQGITVERFAGNMLENPTGFSEPHRHDHYTCFLLDKGRIDTLVDFKETIIKSNTLFISYPGQVHQVIASTNVSGWFLSFDSKLVNEAVRTALEQSLSEVITLLLNAIEVSWFKHIIGLMLDLADDNHVITFNAHVQHSLLTAFIYQAALTYQKREHNFTLQHSTRNISITKKFRQELRRRYKTLKKPSEYADLLNLSVSYLNDTVKEVTGFPISYFIQQEIIREAQRLLYYSDLSIKEIAISLGYSDFKYFNRFFKKATDTTPGTFRKNSIRLKDV